MSETRFYIIRNMFLTCEGNIDKNGDLVFRFLRQRRKLENGFHFATKEEAFLKYCTDQDNQIKDLEKEREELRAQL